MAQFSIAENHCLKEVAITQKQEWTKQLSSDVQLPLSFYEKCGCFTKGSLEFIFNSLDFIKKNHKNEELKGFKFTDDSVFEEIYRKAGLQR